MENYDFDQNPDQEGTIYPKGIAFGTCEFDMNGVLRSSVAINQPPESSQNYSGVDFMNGVDGVMLNEVSGDGSLRIVDERVVMLSDQVCSVSESLVPPLTGEYSVEVAENYHQEVKNTFDFLEFSLLDFNPSSIEDSSASNVYRIEGERSHYATEDVTFSNLWRNQGSLSYNPFENHLHHTPYAKFEEFPMRRIDDMMTGLTVKDLITSSNALASSAPLNQSHELAGVHQYINNINLNNQIDKFEPLRTMTGLSSGHFLSPDSVLDPLVTVNSYNELLRRHLVPNQYTQSIHFNAMMIDLSLGLNWKIKKHILELSMSIEGSLWLMDLISNGDPINIDAIVNVVESDVFTIMADEQGYKVFIQLLDFCDQKQRVFLLDRIVSDSIGVIICVQTFYG